MKCKQCNAELTEWQRSKHSDELIIKYRCDVCGWETADIVSLRQPIKEPPKRD